MAFVAVVRQFHKRVARTVYDYEVRVPLEWLEDVHAYLNAVARKRPPPLTVADLDPLIEIAESILDHAHDALDESIIDTKKQGGVWTVK